MKKKLLAVLLTAAMVATMAACGGGSSDQETEAPAESSEQAGDDAEAEAPAQSDGEAPSGNGADFKIGLITDVGGVNDGSFNQSAWEGLQRAIADLGVEANYLESKTDADYAPNIEAFVDEDYDLIICVGYMLADATKAAAEANPDVKIQQFNADSFADPAGGKSNANTAITNGADIIFHAAGGTGLGVIEACKEADGVYAIGVDSDQSSLAPETIITSAMKRVDNAVYDAVEAVIGGTLESGIHTYDLAAGGVDIAPTQDLLPADVVAAIEEVKEKIINGEVVVPSSQEEFEAAHGDVYELD